MFRLGESYFTRLLMPLLTLIVIVVILSSSVIYREYVDETIEENSDLSEQMLLKTVYSADLIWDWASMHAFELYGNNIIFNTIYGQEVSAMDEYNAQKIISYAMNSNPFIYSIYLYNGNLDVFFSNVSYRHSGESFFDQDIIRFLADQSKYSQFRFIPRSISYRYYNKEYNEDVISLVIAQLPINEKFVSGALVLNVRISSIRDSIAFMNDSPDDYFLIVDGNGTVISHSSPGLFMKDLSHEPYITAVNRFPSYSGHFTEIIEEKKYLVTYVKSDKLDWSFIRINLYSRLFRKTKGLRNIIIVMSILLFVFSAVFTVLLTWRFYSPIKRLVKRMRKEARESEKLDIVEGKNEIEYISGVYNQILENSRLLKQQNLDNKAFLRREFLKSLLTGGFPDYDDAGNRFAELDIRLETRNLLVVILRIDDYWKGFTGIHAGEDAGLVKFAILNISHSIISKGHKNVAIDMGEDLMAIVLNTDDDDPEHLYAGLKMSMAGIQTHIQEYLEVGVSCAIGEKVRNLSNLPGAYRFALMISEYRLIHGKRCLIEPGMVKANMETGYVYSDKVEKEILDRLRLHHFEGVKEKTALFFESLKCLSPGDIRMSISRLLYTSFKTIDEIASRMPQHNFKTLHDELYHFDTVDEIEDWILGIYKASIDAMVNNAQTVKSVYIMKVEEIIREEYGNPNLSPEELASRLDLSVNYLRKIFRELKGISLSCYIAGYRCEKAKDLLIHTKKTVSEISSLIGHVNENYFYTLFKRNSGFTPAQFRNNNKR